MIPELQSPAQEPKHMKRHSYPAVRMRGFSLIEILVVVAIMAILAAVVVPKLMDNPDKARIARAQADIRNLGTALNLYKLDNFVYPSTEQGLDALVSKPGGEPAAPNWKAGGYVERLPKDPWGRDYLFLRPGQNGEYDLYTLGADGQPGGDGPNADIGNWN